MNLLLSNEEIRIKNKGYDFGKYLTNNVVNNPNILRISYLFYGKVENFSARINQGSRNSFSPVIKLHWRKENDQLLISISYFLDYRLLFTPLFMTAFGLCIGFETKSLFPSLSMTLLSIAMAVAFRHFTKTSIPTSRKLLMELIDHY